MKRLLLCGLLLMMLSAQAWAGPPFITNDPDPPDPGQFETIYSATLQQNRNGTQSGEAGDIEGNYGRDPHTQWTCSFPVAYSNSSASGLQVGPGDGILEYKYRFGLDPSKGY